MSDLTGLAEAAQRFVERLAASQQQLPADAAKILYDNLWELYGEAADALAASEARCRALEQDMEALRGMADAERGEWRRDLLEAEARCRALQAQIEQQEAQK
jgi:hypothetical protein